MRARTQSIRPEDLKKSWNRRVNRTVPQRSHLSSQQIRWSSAFIPPRHAHVFWVARKNELVLGMAPPHASTQHSGTTESSSCGCASSMLWCPCRAGKTPQRPPGGRSAIAHHQERQSTLRTLTGGRRWCLQRDGGEEGMLRGQCTQPLPTNASHRSCHEGP